MGGILTLTNRLFARPFCLPGKVASTFVLSELVAFAVPPPRKKQGPGCHSAEGAGGRPPVAGTLRGLGHHGGRGQGDGVAGKKATTRNRDSCHEAQIMNPNISPQTRTYPEEKISMSRANVPYK